MYLIFLVTDFLNQYKSIDCKLTIKNSVCNNGIKLTTIQCKMPFNLMINSQKPFRDGSGKGCSIGIKGDRPTYRKL